MHDREDLRYLIQQTRDDLRHLIQQNHEQIQRQFQEVQAQIDSLHAERNSGTLQKDSDTDGISPCCHRWRRYFETILWTLAIVGLIFGCSWNLREILQDMIESPTVTKMTYTLHDKLSLPPISVYQQSNTPMLHTEKLFKALEDGSLTKAYIEGIIKGVGIGFFLLEQNFTVQPSEITEANKQAILRYGSLTEAGLAFQKEYGIACDELFAYCGDPMPPPINCCDIFESLWGLNGLQYALKKDTIFLDAFHTFVVKLRSLPNIEALQNSGFVEEPGNYQSYWVSISNGVDQTGIDAHIFEVQPSETVLIMLRQKRRKLKISKDCVDLPPKLRYFRDYTISNCVVERWLLHELSLCNIRCEIPLLQLLNPDSFRGPPCEFNVNDSACVDIIKTNQLQCTNHGCHFPCNHTEIEFGVTKALKSGNQSEIVLYFQYDTTEVQMFEETSRLTRWEYLGLIGSILGLWLGISIYSLHRMLCIYLSKIIYCKPYYFGKRHSATIHVPTTEQQHEMANVSDIE